MKQNNQLQTVVLVTIFITCLIWINRQVVNPSVQSTTHNTTINYVEVVESPDYTDYPPNMYLFPMSLDYVTDKQKFVNKYLEYRGETNLATWNKIIEGESKFDYKSVAPTYWHICDRPVNVTLWGVPQGYKNFIELRDYEDGRIWQATCEEYGANTVRSGQSKGLTHIIDPTWELHNCTGDILNWRDHLDCAIKIKNTSGWSQWSTYLIN